MPSMSQPKLANTADVAEMPLSRYNLLLQSTITNDTRDAPSKKDMAKCRRNPAEAFCDCVRFALSYKIEQLVKFKNCCTLVQNAPKRRGFCPDSGVVTQADRRNVTDRFDDGAAS